MNGLGIKKIVQNSGVTKRKIALFDTGLRILKAGKPFNLWKIPTKCMQKKEPIFEQFWSGRILIKVWRYGNLFFGL